MDPILQLIRIFLLVALVIAGPVAAIWLSIKLLKTASWLVRNAARAVLFVLARVLRFVRDSVLDAMRFVGGLLTAALLIPLVFLSLLVLRFKAAGHYGRALEDELMQSLLSLYRVALGNPVRLLGLGALTDGFERRVPDVVARAPGQRMRGPRRKFAGYKVLDTLPAGGSGAQLLLARPRAAKREALVGSPERVVIKCFALDAGSTLPQIVRESRALEAARSLGLVLEHELTDSSFHYVMPYIDGEGLEPVVARLHADAGPEGLGRPELGTIVGLATDVVTTLERFHAGGLWHKDVKPSNVIVAGDRAHLVDLGLVTPLRSALTLTTHGTEFYRDPEMVRMALKGVKVHEVDGVRFDVYSAGALLFAMLENSFPANGSLSPITKRCPEALKWIVRRAMADMGKRYGTAGEMRADLVHLAAAADPFAVEPAELPSFGSRPATEPEPTAEPAAHGASEDPLPALSPRTNGGGLHRVTRRTVAAACIGVVAILVAAERTLTAAAAERNAPAQLEAAHRHGDGGAADSIDRARALLLALQQRGRLPELAGRDPVGPYEARNPFVGAGAGETYLVVEDLRGVADESCGVAAVVARDALREGGRRVIAPDSDVEAELAAIAGVRNAIGVSSPGDEDAGRRLTEYVRDDALLDGVVWIGAAAERCHLRVEIATAGGVQPFVLPLPGASCSHP